MRGPSMHMSSVGPRPCFQLLQLMRIFSLGGPNAWVCLRLGAVVFVDIMARPEDGVHADSNEQRVRIKSVE